MNTQDMYKGILESFQGFGTGFMDRYRESPEDHRNVLFTVRGNKGLDSTDAPRMEKVMGTNPTVSVINELAGRTDPETLRVKKELEMDLRGSTAHKVGQVGGTLAQDITNDGLRSIWWLINAPQAVANIIAEQALAKHTDLYASDVVKKPDGTPLTTSKADERIAREMNILSDKGETKKGYAHMHEFDENRKKTGKTFYTKRRYSPTVGNLMTYPAGFVVNAGMGLMTPFGGQPGYEAVFPSEEDPSKTANVAAEVATKYFLGRTGKLLPYDEFSKHRPDVSKAEYNKYKAYKWDKELDYNPFDDGEVNLLPEGVLKATMDGIHGPEVQFLGRSLPVATTLMPLTTGVIGTALVASTASKFNPATGMRDAIPGRSTTRRGFLGGVAGAAGGLAVGHLLEAERQRRNQIANFG